ncbi:MAG: succinylglutamate desuccinylase/aspartoacylase family protein [Reyranellaceae bacterium]
MPATLHLPLASPAPGTERHLTLHRFGKPGARPKAYFQAALHADELPGVLVLQHLLALLASAEREGRLKGEVLIVPAANPIGLAQTVHGRLLGRYGLDASGNFNRGFPDLSDGLVEALRNRLGRDAAANATLVRTTLLTLLSEKKALGEAPQLRLTLMRLAIDADIALDLHCDDQALLHIYAGPKLWPEISDLAALLGAAAVLLEEDSGGEPFDEALARPWWRLIDANPGAALSAAAMITGTVELRGRADIDDAQARKDAQALLAFLVRRGVVAGDAGALPPLSCQGTALDAVDFVKAPHAGLLVQKRALGERVRAGDVVAEIVEPMAASGAGRTQLLARTEGVVFTRAMPGLVRAGKRVMKIAGKEKLEQTDATLLGD